MGFIGNKPADTFHTTVKQSFTPDSSTIAFSLNQSVAGEKRIAGWDFICGHPDDSLTKLCLIGFLLSF